MFETAVVHAHVRASHFSLLSFSLAIHSAVIFAVIAASVASTRLPAQAPNQMSYPLPTVALPPALGTPAPPKAAASRRTPKAVEAAMAPATIPTTIAPVEAQPSTAGPSDGTATVRTPGLPTGTPGGILTDGQPTGVPDASGPLLVGNGVESPVVLHRVDPIYPPFAVRSRMNGVVVLECIIDKGGHVRDVRVARSTFAAFEQPAIDAVQKWLFAPGTLTGQPVDTIFELTVRFEVR